MLKIILLIMFILSVPLLFLDRIYRIDRIEEEEVLPKDRQGRSAKHDTGVTKRAVARRRRLQPSLSCLVEY